MKPPYFRKSDVKVTELRTFPAKVTIQTSSTYTRVKRSESGAKVTKSDGFNGKVELFLDHFCQECPVQGARSRGS